MSLIAVTNNSLISETTSDTNVFSDILFDGKLSYENVLRKSEDMIKRGSILLISPFFGSLPPFETPFKTLVLSEGKDIIDFYSLCIIRRAVQNARKSADTRPKAFWGKNDLDCFKKGDLVIIERWLAKVYIPNLKKEMDVLNGKV